MVRLWNIATGDEVRTLSGYGGGIYAVATSPDGSLIVSGGANKLIDVWDTRTGRLLRSTTEDSNPLLEISARWPPLHIVSRHNQDSGRGIGFSGAHVDQRQEDWLPARNRQACNFKDNRFLVGGINQGLRIGETASWQVVRTLDRRNIISALAIALSPDGTYLAASDSNQDFRLWEVATGRVFPAATG